MEPEHQQVLEELQNRGVTCETFTMKRLDRNQLIFDNETLVVGDHEVMKRVFKRLRYNCNTDAYPEELRSYLKRNLRYASVQSFLSDIALGAFQPSFVKPKEDSKLFTGFIVSSEVSILTNLPKNTKIYISEIVDWQSEFRVFVIKSKIVGIQYYHGDKNQTVDLDVVQQAVEDFRRSEQYTEGYALDFGVLKNGETALVEWNDGYALGAYDLDKSLYTDLLISRWEEIIEKVF